MEWPETTHGALANAAANIYHASQASLYAADLAAKPSYMLKPRLFIDGDKWCALYGENLQDGVAGFGGSPADAYADFDKAWTRQLPKLNGSDSLPDKKRCNNWPHPGTDKNGHQCRLPSGHKGECI